MCVVTSYYRLEEAYIVDINITVFNQLKKASQTLCQTHTAILHTLKQYTTLRHIWCFFHFTTEQRVYSFCLGIQRVVNKYLHCTALQISIPTIKTH